MALEFQISEEKFENKGDQAWGRCRHSCLLFAGGLKAGIGCFTVCLSAKRDGLCPKGNEA